MLDASQTDSLVESMITFTTAVCLMHHANTFSYFLCCKSRPAANPLATAQTPSDAPASRDLQTGSTTPLSAKNTFLSVHFTAMPLVNPARFD